MTSRILAVDAEKHILELARLYLTREGYEVEGVGDGAQAVARFSQVKPDLVILDIMLPGVDGLTICKEIRKQSQVPIIMLTARDEVTDKVVGLEVGADDYLTKPFHPQELVARAKALLRRARTESDQPKLVRAGKLEVDLERHEVRYGSERVQLQLDRQVMVAALAVKQRECDFQGSVTGPCRLASDSDFTDRLRTMVPQLGGERLLLLDAGRRIVFDSEASDTLGTQLSITASKRVSGVGEAQAFLDGKDYLAAA